MKKIQNLFWAILVPIAVIGYVVYKIAVNSFTDHFLGSNPQYVKAVIINEKNYLGNQPVHPKFSYSYLFVAGDKKYTGNAHDTTLQIGDTVEIEYNKDYPNINKPLHPRE